MADLRGHIVVALFAGFVGLAVPCARAADMPAAPEVTLLSDIMPLPLTVSSATVMRAPEITPTLLSGPGGLHLIYLGTAFTYLCSYQGNPLEAPVTLQPSDCAVVDLPGTQSSPKVYVAPSDIPPGRPWKRNYDGVFSAQVTHDSVAGNDVIVTVNHNEVKNEITRDGQRYQSPFAPAASDLPADCGVGGYAGRGQHHYQACWQAYGAFISLETVAITRETNFGRILNESDIGPVIWPTNGYYDLSRGVQGELSDGVRHPSSIISGGYFYIFYLDTSKARIGGLSASGTKVARAQISARGIPGSFFAWDGHAFAASELPRGFDAKNMINFIARPGPQVSSLFAAEAARDPGYDLQSTHFSVGYDAHRHIYVGVEEVVAKEEGERGRNIALRLSPDLVHWSARTVLDVEGKLLTYPKLSNAAFTSNNDLDLDNLYVVGRAHGELNYVHLKVR